MIVCKLIHYSGRVQGVGFRYAAQRLAEGFPISGHVRNLPGGDVELVAEGEGEDVEKFLDAVCEKMAGYIAGQTVTEQAPAGLNGFIIRY